MYFRTQNCEFSFESCVVLFGVCVLIYIYIYIRIEHWAQTCSHRKCAYASQSKRNIKSTRTSSICISSREAAQIILRDDCVWWWERWQVVDLVTISRSHSLMYKARNWCVAVAATFRCYCCWLLLYCCRLCYNIKVWALYTCMHVYIW